MRVIMRFGSHLSCAHLCFCRCPCALASDAPRQPHARSLAPEADVELEARSRAHSRQPPPWDEAWRGAPRAQRIFGAMCVGGRSVAVETSVVLGHGGVRVRRFGEHCEPEAQAPWVPQKLRRIARCRRTEYHHNPFREWQLPAKTGMIFPSSCGSRSMGSPL